MKHILIEKYKVLNQIKEEFRNYSQEKTINIKHGISKIEDVYGFTYHLDSGQKTVFCSVIERQSSPSVFQSRKLSSFPEDVQKEYESINSSYISMCDLLLDLQNEMRKEFIGKMVISSSKPEPTPITSLYFGLGTLLVETKHILITHCKPYTEYDFYDNDYN